MILLSSASDTNTGGSLPVDCGVLVGLGDCTGENPPSSPPASNVISGVGDSAPLPSLCRLLADAVGENPSSSVSVVCSSISILLLVVLLSLVLGDSNSLLTEAAISAAVGPVGAGCGAGCWTTIGGCLSIAATLSACCLICS